MKTNGFSQASPNLVNTCDFTIISFEFPKGLTLIHSVNTSWFYGSSKWMVTIPIWQISWLWAGDDVLDTGCHTLESVWDSKFNKKSINFALAAWRIALHVSRPFDTFTSSNLNRLEYLFALMCLISNLKIYFNFLIVFAAVSPHLSLETRHSYCVD
jgi:hypothetical protein